ncbi:MAG: hypothetical protein U9N41_05800 [Euryarchaeota archaeon]|nr:hypothetical protein [Euryarchaeota archaeon]
MTYDALLKVFDELAAYLSAYNVISEGELVLKIRESIKSLLTGAERVDLETKLNGTLEDVIFNSITSTEKVSVFSPDMHTRINYQGEVFYCVPTHRYMSNELEEAFLRWARIRSPPSALKRVVKDFMERCGYQVENTAPKNEHIEMIAVKKHKNQNRHRSKRIFIFPSITFVPQFVGEIENSEAEDEKGNGSENVIVVPTEKTPAPFISFFREQDAGATMIWVADVEKRTIDPFIGIPEDEAIENNFANPEQARRAVSVWMKKMHFVEL